jgi:cell division protein FtsN
MNLFQPKFTSGTHSKNESIIRLNTTNASVIKDDEADAERPESTLVIKTNDLSDVIKKEDAEIESGKIPAKKPAVKIAPVITSHVDESANCDYHVIVGSFSIPENAEAFKTTVQKKGYSAKLIESSQGLTYVSAACFSTRDDATAAISGIYNDLDVRGWVLKN